MTKNDTLHYVNGREMKENEKSLLDQYFTKSEIASYLFEKTKEIISKYEGSIEDYTWIEPAAGAGDFYDLLPADKRIGIDIEPLRDEFVCSDYLKYTLPEGKNIVFGNPPFGHRGVMALEFINHSSSAEYVCFILPMFYESKGKGSVKYRVKGLNLIHSERLPKDSFYLPFRNNRSANINCVFQIWSKNHKSEVNDDFSWYNNTGKEPFKDLLSVYTVSLAKKRECGKHWIFEEKADFYVSSTFYGNIDIVDDFSKVKYKSGIAVVFNTNDEEKRKKVMEVFRNTDWTKYATPATNSCYHLGKSHIFEVLKKNENLL